MTKAEHWYALTTKPRSEQAACARAEHFGFRTYVPMCEKKVMVNRHTKERKPKSFPMLPGIIFVGAEQEITPSLLMALIEPLRASIPLGYGDCPKRLDRAQWASFGLSVRNRKISPITGIIGNGDEPGLIHNDAIERMKKKNADQDAAAAARERGEIEVYKPETTVRILEGPFEGFNGLVVVAKGHRAKIMASVFGGEVPVELSIEHIEAA